MNSAWTVFQMPIIADRRKSQNSTPSESGSIEKLLDQKNREVEKLTEEIKRKSRDLKEAKIALRVVMRSVESEKHDIEESILTNIHHLVIPWIEKIKASGLSQEQASYVVSLEENLERLTSRFSKRLVSPAHKLTPTELQIANMVKNGRTSKEIAEMLHISRRTVSFHRENVRKKLGLGKSGGNLRTYLLYLE
jgi:DNA-binding CsgD family transcriptional regulator